METAPVVPTPEIKEDNQEELIAVIAAAISACGHQVFGENIKRIYGILVLLGQLPVEWTI